jgi:hypothetical protein
MAQEEGQIKKNKGKYILETQEQKAYICAMKAPESLAQAIVYFSDPERAFEYAKQLRWPDGKVARAAVLTAIRLSRRANSGSAMDARSSSHSRSVRSLKIPRFPWTSG